MGTLSSYYSTTGYIQQLKQLTVCYDSQCYIFIHPPFLDKVLLQNFWTRLSSLVEDILHFQSMGSRWSDAYREVEKVKRPEATITGPPKLQQHKLDNKLLIILYI